MQMLKIMYQQQISQPFRMLFVACDKWDTDAPEIF